jgi:L-ascorbate metabolism protein UlaG (beta-lactamase superfamily)
MRRNSTEWLPRLIRDGLRSAVQLTFVGHATVRLDGEEAMLLTDPVLRRHVGVLRSTAAIDRVVPAPDRAVVVLISHLHLDHCDVPSLRRLGNALSLVVPRGAESFFTRRGFRNVIALSTGETVDVRGFTIAATSAEHDGRRWPGGPDRGVAGYVVTSAGSRVYFAGDTDLCDEMEGLDAPDVALLPVWGWGRNLGPGHLDPGRAARAVELIRPRVAVPIHWGTLRPAWDRRPVLLDGRSPAQAFVEHVRSRQLPTHAEVLMPGQALAVPG